MCHVEEKKPTQEAKRQPAQSAPADAKRRKDKVLHTRVPEVLDQELKRLADSLRVPVSNVVRAILMDAVEAADTVGQRAEGELRSVVNRLTAKREQLHAQTTDALRAGAPLPAQPSQHPSSPDTAAPAATTAATTAAPVPPLAGVIGFQPLLLAKPTVCALSGREIAAGEQAYMGISDRPGHAPIIAPECLPFAHKP